MTFQSNKEYVIKELSPEALLQSLYYKNSGMYGCVQLVEDSANDVFLPQTIAEKLRKLSIFKYTPAKIPANTRPVTTLSCFSNKISADFDKLNSEGTYIPESNFSVIQFIDAYFDIKDTIVEWYKDNGLDLNELNI